MNLFSLLIGPVLAVCYLVYARHQTRPSFPLAFVVSSGRNWKRFPSDLNFFQCEIGLNIMVFVTRTEIYLQFWGCHVR